MDKTVKILIVGDSWANTIRKGGIGGASDKNPFTKALNRHGFPQYDTIGEKTVWGGMRADDLNKEDIRELFKREITSLDDLTTIHLIVGGNDFLHEAVDNSLLKKSEPVIESYLNEIASRVTYMVEYFLSVGNNVDVLFSGYDFVDIIKAGEIIGFETSSLTFESFNYWFEILNSKIKERLKTVENCYFVDNMGRFHSLNNPETKTDLYKEPINMNCYKNDGIHPNKFGDRIILDNCFESYYMNKFEKENLI